MRITCAYCQKAGRPSLIGFKAPLENPAETHSICRPCENEQRRSLGLPDLPAAA